MVTLTKTTKRPWIPERKPQQGRQRSNSKFYHSPAWRKLRSSYIINNPLCEECLKKGLTVEANVVDHITPVNQGGASLDMANLQSLCHSCHNRKSGREAHPSR